MSSEFLLELLRTRASSRTQCKIYNPSLTPPIPVPYSCTISQIESTILPEHCKGMSQALRAAPAALGPSCLRQRITLTTCSKGPGSRIPPNNKATAGRQDFLAILCLEFSLPNAAQNFAATHSLHVSGCVGGNPWTQGC